MARPTKRCACGNVFEQSRQNVTVRCPSCRKSSRGPKRVASKLVLCNCGKTVLVDSFGMDMGVTCPREC